MCSIISVCSDQGELLYTSCDIPSTTRAKYGCIFYVHYVIQYEVSLVLGELRMLYTRVGAGEAPLMDTAEPRMIVAGVEMNANLELMTLLSMLSGPGYWQQVLCMSN